jgi:hypothetical protein
VTASSPHAYGRSIGLAAFAEASPGLARRLLGREVAPSLFADEFRALLDRSLRSTRVDLRFVRVVRTFSYMEKSGAWPFFVDCLRAQAAQYTRARLRSGSPRSLWGTTPIVNMIPCARADRLLGMNAETVVLTTYRITSEFDVVLKNQEDWFVSRAMPQWPWFRWVAFAWALLEFDVFFYFNDRGLLPAGGYGSDRFGINAMEMEMIRSAGKCLYTLAYGADHRSRERTFREGTYSLCMDCPDIGRFCICDEKQAARVLGKIHSHANAMLGAGISLAQLPDPARLDYLVVDVERIEPVYPRPPCGRPLRVVHVPNHGFFKGTRFLEAAIAALQAEGVPVELVRVTGVTNEEALALMASADVVADQFISGSIGYTAIEAMALGKPVLCFVRDDIPLPDRARLPIVNVTPDTLKDALRRLAGDMSTLTELGMRSREYVEVNYSIEALAPQLLSVYSTTSALGSMLRLKPEAARKHEGRVRARACAAAERGQVANG